MKYERTFVFNSCDLPVCLLCARKSEECVFFNPMFKLKLDDLFLKRASVAYLRLDGEELLN